MAVGMKKLGNVTAGEEVARVSVGVTEVWKTSVVGEAKMNGDGMLLGSVP